MDALIDDRGPAPLPRRTLGRTGIQVSILGLGAVKLGRNTAVKYPTPFELPTDAEARSLIDLAADLGINLIDTAPAYGVSEERVGAILAGRRDRWIISTKVGEEFDSASARSRFDFSPEHTRASVERSLRRLRTDHVDIVLVHSDGDDERIVRECGTLGLLADLKSEGKIRAIGFSPKSFEGARGAAEVSDVLMLALNADDQSMLPLVRSGGGQGILIKKGLRSGHIGAAQGATDAIAGAFGFLLREPAVSSVVVGTISPEHLLANARAAAAALGPSPLGS